MKKIWQTFPLLFFTSKTILVFNLFISRTRLGSFAPTFPSASQTKGNKLAAKGEVY